MRRELLDLKCDPALSQQVRREIMLIANSPSCQYETDPDMRFKIATAFFIQRKSGVIPVGRDEYGQYVAGMRTMSKMVDIIATHKDGDLKEKIRGVIAQALLDRKEVWENPLLHLPPN